GGPGSGRPGPRPDTGTWGARADPGWSRHYAGRRQAHGLGGSGLWARSTERSGVADDRRRERRRRHGRRCAGTPRHGGDGVSPRPATRLVRLTTARSPLSQVRSYRCVPVTAARALRPYSRERAGRTIGCMTDAVAVLGP